MSFLSSSLVDMPLLSASWSRRTLWNRFLTRLFRLQPLKGNAKSSLLVAHETPTEQNTEDLEKDTDCKPRA
ncbi:hypothetical protein N7448_007543 [Penicillium atrosanguineum]|uniref:Uncharacterized protein n=1 Tax=Penicillium atrosanguineum TaxID=1132637 RepID=A0A9W9GPW2_9EURO|nr:Cyclic-AMP phosphodiesterase class-II [Penicillium atrosanguineum]KAJ5126764.1 hypothetical protein N7448_007543 [Penicillium atrosanguineum]KAJ5146968.1 hypothetical protein N7526_000320 [Penicillium atrosanguineum]KAJ5314549.1 Cyclic-AMP phosphodiesterase class-II [Penicillium atrosanguineum]KAJ5331720.1 hypothetical protein N7476_001503 [Penicillium atrosanguineum]